jgi:hypothetical protein
VTADGDTPVDAARKRGEQHSLFSNFYSPTTLSSFDELLSRPYLHAQAYPTKPQPPVPTPPQEPPVRVGFADFEGRDAPAGWLTKADDGSGADHPLFEQTASWGGRIEYPPMGETLEVSTIGDGLRVLLPKGYVECDAWQADADALLHGHAGDGEAEEIYARFTTHDNVKPSNSDAVADAYAERYAAWSQQTTETEVVGVAT